MNAKMLSKVIEVENRVNTICKCLVMGGANHITVVYSYRNVCITAYTSLIRRAYKLADVMRINAEPEDILILDNLAGQESNFWTTQLTIPLE